MAVQAGQVQVGLELEHSQFTRGMHQASQSVNNFVSGIGGAGKQVGVFGNALGKAGVAVGALGFSLLKFAKHSVHVADGVDEMNVAIEAVGKATGLGGDKIKDAANKVRSMGIEMQAAQEIAMLFVKSNINLAQAHDMARVAQDLAVLSQSNSTDTARTLVYAIQTGNSVLLKSAGITKYASEAYAQYARQLKKSTTALTATERQQAILNMVLEEGKKVAGVYEAAMQEPGKVLRSFPRIINDIQLEFGRLFTHGLGPAILGAYNMTSAFSKLLREGGALYPIMHSISEAFTDALKPIKAMFDYITLGIKKFSVLDLHAEGLKDTITKLLPSVAGLATGLSMLGARSLLAGLGSIFPMLAPLSGIIGRGGPIIAGLTVMAALSPQVRDSFMGLKDSLMPLVEPMKELGAIAMDVFNQMIEVANELMVALADDLTSAISVFASVLKGVSAVAIPLLKVFASFAGVLAQWGPLVQIIASVLISKWVIAFATTNATVLKLSATMMTFGAKMKLIAWQSATTFNTMKSMGASTFAALKISSKAAFMQMIAGARAAGAAIMTSLAPLIAVTAAVMVAMKIFQAWNDRNKDLNETTKRVTDSIKEQVKELKGGSQAIIDYLNNTALLNEVLNGQEDAGEKIAASMNYLGIATDKTGETLAAMQTDSKGLISTLLRQNGVVGEANDAITDFVDSHDKKTPEEFAKTMRNTYYNALENGVIVSKKFTEEQISLALYLEELQDQSENTDFEKYRDSLRTSILATSKLGGKVVKTSDELYEQWLELNRGADGAAKFAKYQEILKTQMESAAKASGELSDAMPTIAADNAAKALYGLNKQLLEGELTADMVKKAMFGSAHAMLENSRATYDMDKALGKTIDQVKAAKGNFTKLKDAGYSLLDQFAANNQKIIELGGTTKDQLDMMKAQAEQFKKSAIAAGFEEEEVNALLESLGILASIKNIETTLDVNTAKAKADLLEYTQILARLSPAGSKESGKLQEAISELKKVVSQASNSAEIGKRSWQALGETQKNSSSKTATLKEATEMLNKKIKDQKRAVVEAKQALQDYARDSASSIYKAVSVGSVYDRYMAQKDKNDQIRERNKAIMAQKEADRVAQQREDARKLVDSKNKLIDAENQLIELQNEFANAVGDSVSAVLSFSGVVSQQQSAVADYQQALGKQADSQAKVNEAQAEYQALSNKVAQIQQKLSQTTGRYARRVLGEELVKAQDDAAESLANLAVAQQELSVATEEANQAQSKQITFLQGLEQQAIRAVKFGSIIERLTAAGLSKEALRQVADAGAEVGTTMGEELLAGGVEAISKANEFSKQIIDEGRRVTGIFSQTLKERLEYEVYEDKPVYEELGEEVGETFAQSLAKQSEKAKEFTSKVRTLISMGLRGTQLEEVVNAGVDAGTKIADALIASGAGTIQQSVAMYDELKNLSKKFGDELVPYFDQTGILLAEALLKALQQKLKDLPTILKGKSGKEIYEWMEDFDDSFADTSREIANTIGGTPTYTAPSSGTYDFAGAEMAAAAAMGYTKPEDLMNFWSGFGGGNLAVPFAKGGIVTAPTLGLVGEAGAEAIIPLNQLGNFGGNNYSITVNAGMGTNGAQVGAQIVEAIKKYEKSNGTRWRS